MYRMIKEIKKGPESMLKETNKDYQRYQAK